MANRKKRLPDAAQKQAGAEAARVFGKHVSQKKGRVLLAVSLAACALPAVLGLRLWDRIPETVTTGLIGPDGKDDSLPRVVVVFGMPALMCLLNLICHLQLLLNQKRMTMPSRHVRLLGRMGFPIVSVMFSGGLMLEAAQLGYPASYVTPCVLGLLLLLLGAHMLDCPEDARLSLRPVLRQGSDWKAVHSLTAYIWLAGGLLVIAGAMLGGGGVLAAASLAVLVLPLLMARFG